MHLNPAPGWTQSIKLGKEFTWTGERVHARRERIVTRSKHNSVPADCRHAAYKDKRNKLYIGRIKILEFRSLEDGIHRPDSSLHIEDIGLGIVLRTQHPDLFLDLMDQLVNNTVRIAEITKGAGAGRTGSGTAGLGFPLGQPFVPTEITLVDGMLFLVEIPGIIGTGKHAGFTANAFFVVHPDYAGHRILIGGLGRTAPHTGGIVAMVTENRYKFHRLVQGADIFLGQNPRSVGIVRDIIGFDTCLDTSLAVNAHGLTDNHGIMGTVYVAHRPFSGG